MSKWNGNKFSVYESEEKTVLGLLDELGSQVNHNTDNLKNKTDLYGDHKGSWQGLSRPTMSEEGMRATVEDIIDNKIPAIESSLDNIAIVSSKLQEVIDNNSIKKIILPKIDNLIFKNIVINRNDLEIDLNQNTIELDCSVSGKNITIKNGIVRTLDAKPSFLIGSSYNIIFENIDFIHEHPTYGGGANAIILVMNYNTFEKMEVKNCRFRCSVYSDAGVDGIKLVGNVNSSLKNVIIEKCIFENISRIGIEAITNVDGIKIENCHFKNFNGKTNCMGISLSQNRIINGSVIGNTFENIKGYGIELVGCHNVNLNNNIFKSSEETLNIINTSSNYADRNVENIIIEGNKTDGYCGKAIIKNIKNSIISNNIFYLKEGFSLQSSSFNKIYGNNITSKASKCIGFENSYKNNVYHNDFSIVENSSAYSVIELLYANTEKNTFSNNNLLKSSGNWWRYASSSKECYFYNNVDIVNNRVITSLYSYGIKKYLFTANNNYGLKITNLSTTKQADAIFKITITSHTNNTPKHCYCIVGFGNASLPSAEPVISNVFGIALTSKKVVEVDGTTSYYLQPPTPFGGGTFEVEMLGASEIDYSFEINFSNIE